MTVLILTAVRLRGEALAAALKGQRKDSFCLVVGDPGEAEAALGEVLIDCMVLPPPLLEQFRYAESPRLRLVPWPAETPPEALAELLADQS